MQIGSRPESVAKLHRVASLQVPLLLKESETTKDNFTRSGRRKQSGLKSFGWKTGLMTRTMASWVTCLDSVRREAACLLSLKHSWSVVILQLWKVCCLFLLSLLFIESLLFLCEESRLESDGTRCINTDTTGPQVRERWMGQSCTH